LKKNKQSKSRSGALKRSSDSDASGEESPEIDSDDELDLNNHGY
jgi:hypothetical protein